MKNGYFLGLFAVASIGTVFLLYSLNKEPTKAPKVELIKASPKDFKKNRATNQVAAPHTVDATSNGLKRPIFRSPAPAHLPSGNLKSNLPDLERRAFAGNAAVAYSLAMDLFSCYGKSQANDAPFTTDPSTTFGVKCQGLEKQDYKKAIDLLAYSARNGDVNAQNAYMGQIGNWVDRNPELQFKGNFMSDYATNSIKFLRQAVESGNGEAMVNLSNIYDMGIIAPKDPVAAYAYMYSAEKTGLFPAAHRQLIAWQRQLTPEQISRGVEKGDAIFKNCCKAK